jgi:hypothetical protein
VTVKPAGGGKVENMDSTDKAKTLKTEDFGTPEEVREMAKTSRAAHSYDEARSMLRELVGKPLNSRAGIQATVSNKSIDKILSGMAVDKSFDMEAHFSAAANIEHLYSNAIEPFKFDRNLDKNNEHLAAIHRLYAPMEFKNMIIPVKFTVKEMDNELDGNRIYTLEAIDFPLERKK